MLGLVKMRLDGLEGKTTLYKLKRNLTRNSNIKRYNSQKRRKLDVISLSSTHK